MKLNSDFLALYEEELEAFRRLGGEFGKRHPAQAAQLYLEEDRSKDPHVERLLQGAAFLAARVRQKIEDGLPEIAESYLGALYPESLTPIPSSSIAELELDPDQGRVSTGYRIPRRTRLLSEQIRTAGSVQGPRCVFETCSDVTLWPIKVTRVAYGVPEGWDLLRSDPDPVAGLEVRLTAAGDGFADLEIPSLRFFLGSNYASGTRLFEALCGSLVRVYVKGDGPKDRGVPLNAGVVPAGYGEDEALTASARRAFRGHRLLREYFALPQKFLFVDLQPLDQLRRYGRQVDLLFVLSSRVRGQMLRMDSNSVRLGCVPVVNHYERSADPINLTHLKSEYRVVPSADRDRDSSMEVLEVLRVNSTKLEIDGGPVYAPLSGKARSENAVLWVARRKTVVERNRTRSDVFLSFVNRKLNLERAVGDRISVGILCSDAFLPTRLDPSRLGLRPDGFPGLRSARLLRVPTPTSRPVVDGDTVWRLVAFLSGGSSLLGGSSAPEAAAASLRTVLEIYTGFEDASQIPAIESVETRRRLQLVYAGAAHTHVPGIEIELLVDESRFEGSSAYVFGCVLHRALSFVAPLNSFADLTLRDRSRRIGRWTSLSGERSSVAWTG